MIENPRKYQNAPFLTRFLAGIIDFGIVLFLSVFSSMFIYSGVSKGKNKLNDAITSQILHVNSSHLADDKQASYTSDNYFDKKDDNYLIISSLSYFYTVYLAGDEAKASYGDVVSPNADAEITVNDEKTTARTCYTVAWFNANVLQLPVGEQVAKHDYFMYQKNELNENDYSKIGKISEKYVQDGVVNASDEMVSFIYEQYKIAADLLFDQNYMVEYQNTIDKTQALITMLCRLTYVVIFYEILPLCLVRGKSLGKLCMRLSLVQPNEEPIKRWQTIPRGLIMTVLPLYLYFVNHIILQLVFVLALLITLIVLYATDKKQHKVLHDLISQTIVIEDVKGM